MKKDPPNPYHNTSSITDPKSFFGRVQITQSVFSALFSERPQNISIVGQRKIGKSSLVQHVSRVSTINAFNYDPSKLVFVYFDCQKRSYALRSASTLYQEIVRCIRTALPKELCELTYGAESAPTFVGQDLEHVLNKLDLNAITVIAIFDEFEKAVAQSELITSGFFGSLRGYTQANKNFAWITCTSRPLYDLFEDSFGEFGITKARRKSESDFYSIAPPLNVGLFSDTEVAELINHPVRGTGVAFSSLDKTIIQQLCGNFPYFIQRTCYHLFNMHLHGQVNHDVLREQCLREFSSIWEDYIDKLDVEQQQTLVSVAKGISIDLSAIQISFLKDAGLVVSDSEELRTFCDEFGNFIIAKSEQKRRELTSNVDEISELKNELGRKSLVIRLLLSLIVLVAGFGGLILFSKLKSEWLLQHPRKTGIYICSGLVVIGLAWLILDTKRRLIIFLSVVLAAILVFAQLS